MSFRKTYPSRVLAVVLVLCLMLGAFGVTAWAGSYDPANYRLTGNGAEDIVGIAQTQLGYAESGSGATKYGEHYGNARIDWCCAFVSWCADKANIATTVLPRNVSCTAMKNAFERMGKYYPSSHYGGNYTPVTGDLIFFSSSYSTSDITHIGIVTGVQDAKVYTVEGNYSNHVASVGYALNAAKVVGYGHPDYIGSFDGYRTGTYITGSTMNFRSEPNTSAQIYCLIPGGTSVMISEISGAWGKTVYDGYTGWMNLDYSTYKDPSSPGGSPAWLIADISQFNEFSKFDWNKLKQSGLDGVIIRIGGRYYGPTKALYVDNAFVQNYTAAKAAGLHVGVYFFSYALNEEQAREEAQLTLNLLRENQMELDLPIFIDIEDGGEVGSIDYQHSKAGKAVCTAVVDNFCKTVEQAGYYAGVYANKYIAEELLEEWVFTGRAVWIAHYGVSQCGYKGYFDMWQYTRSGRIDGFSGNIDLSYCYTDLPAIVKGINRGEYNPYGSHQPSDWQIVTAPTCARDGLQQVVCTDCGVVLSTRAIKKTDHRASGKCVYLLDTSLRPGDLISDDILARIHKESDADYDLYAQTCQSQGGTVLTYCTDCKTVVSATYAYTACRHPASSVTVSSGESTCVTPGVTKSVCGDCGNTISAQLLSIGEHIPDASLACTKTDCGQEGEYITTCAVCQQVISTEYAEPTDHHYDRWDTVEDVSCLQNGKYTATCTVCGKFVTRVVDAPMYGDADLNGEIAVGDARAALRIAVGLDDSDESAKCAADIDRNGEVTAADARMILRFVVSLENRQTYFAQYYGEDALANFR